MFALTLTLTCEISWPMMSSLFCRSHACSSTLYVAASGFTSSLNIRSTRPSARLSWPLVAHACTAEVYVGASRSSFRACRGDGGAGEVEVAVVVAVAVAARHLRLRQQVHHPLELARAAARVDGDAIVDGGRGEVIALHLPQQLHHVPRLLGRGARAHHSFVRVHRRVDAAHLKIWKMWGQIWEWRGYPPA